MAVDVNIPRSFNSALSSITSSTTAVTLVEPNGARLGALFFNDSTANLFIGLTSNSVTTTSYTVKVAAGGYYEVPWVLQYCGQINGVWDAANGAARVTELF